MLLILYFGMWEKGVPVLRSRYSIYKLGIDFVQLLYIIEWMRKIVLAISLLLLFLGLTVIAFLQNARISEQNIEVAPAGLSPHPTPMQEVK